MDRETAEVFINALGARSGIVAVVGAGGKKSALYRLLEAHRALGAGRILLTSTVQIATPPQTLDVETLIVDADAVEAGLAETTGRNGAWLIAGPAQKRDASKPERYSGLAEDLVQHLHRQGAFTLSLVKADGARMRMIKAPAENEPALPESVSTVLPIVSARVFGRPLSEKLAHRPERLSRIIDAEFGTEITPHHVARLLASPEGALRRVGNAEVVPVINMVDNPERLALAREAAETALALTERFGRVVLTSLTSQAPLVEIVAR